MLTVLVLAAVAAGLFGLLVGWQARGFHEIARRGHDIDLTRRRP